jgi:hypothetical protein
MTVGIYFFDFYIDIYNDRKIKVKILPYFFISPRNGLQVLVIKRVPNRHRSMRDWIEFFLEEIL